MPLPTPPHSSPKPAWYSVSRWFDGAQARTASVPGHAPSESDVEALRTQARRRLIGAVVLLAVGVVAFPLVFETEPRPMGVDMPMQRVQGSVTGAGEPVMPAEPPLQVATDPNTQAAAPRPEAAPTAAEPPSGESTPAATAPAVAAAPPVLTPAQTPAPVTAPVTPAAEPPPTAAQRDQAQRAEAQRARALLEGRSATAPPVPATRSEPLAAARYVVQVGAFTEQRALTEARSRVERLGLKTYTQVINSPAGPRTRVRVGPFDSRADADAAGAKLRAAGLPAAILTL